MQPIKEHVTFAGTVRIVFVQRRQESSTKNSEVEIIRSKTSSAKEKQLKFHDGQYQFKVPFLIHADFESILKPDGEQ